MHTYIHTCTHTYTYTHTCIRCECEILVFFMLKNHHICINLGKEGWIFRLFIQFNLDFVFSRHAIMFTFKLKPLRKG